eukprot:gene3909-5399_t
MRAAAAAAAAAALLRRADGCTYDAVKAEAWLAKRRAR